MGIRDKFELKGRNYIVTGGAMGIGYNVSRDIAEMGGNIAVLDLEAQPKEPLFELREKFNVKIHYFQCDVGIEQALDSAFEQAVAALGSLDGIVTCAGIAIDKPFPEQTWQEVEKIFHVNSMGTFHSTQLAVTQMQKQKTPGSIVLIASITAHSNLPGFRMAGYNMSKGGVKMLSKALSAELAPFGIRVNSISPAFIRTNQTQVVRDAAPTAVSDLMDTTPPMRRIGEANEVSPAAVYLLSDASAYTTGADILITGGIHTGRGGDYEIVQPCSNCVKRQNVEACVFKDHLPRVAGKPKPRSTRPEHDELQSTVTPLSPSNVLSPALLGIPNCRGGDEHHKKRQRTERPFTEGPNTAPNMLWTSRGVQVHVGSSASLSFLILLRDTLTKYTGSSTFTDASHSSVMLENRSPVTGNDHLAECSHSFDEHVELIDMYYAATSGVLDVIPKKNDLLAHMQAIDTSGIQLAVLHAVIAIGAQCRGGLQDKQCERTHIAKARRVAFNALQDDQLDVNLVRVFITMAYYMFGACRRNTAFMYIGIAARASDTLGLYLQPANTYLWKSVRILDLLVAAILGRSPATADYSRSNWRVDKSPTHRQLCLNASYGVWSIVDQIVQKLYRKSKTDANIVKDFLDRLSRWSAELPPPLKSDPPQGLSEIEQRGYVIGNVHVSCAYYYAVVIATRQYLIAVLHRALSGAQATNTTETTQLANACVESALLMLQTCREVREAGILLDNMCLLKAWVFASGMIVGFAFFVDPYSYTGLEQALIDACHVLQHLSILSPQAKQYYDILQALHKAATEHHERQTAKAPDVTPLVTKIFSLGQGPTETDISEASSSGNTLLSSSLPAEQTFFFDNHFECADSVAVQFWDELLLDTCE
ncbi:hypothetical protein AMS68_001589 [Peltaster fructicola]|uniref:Xylanolytic transcriptional activator regulatory domain-containing protein n=1 Tax=Peltaster fructicola TaxID=286661 RepID=A0A6H0XMT7_9PEZI|nr:hypothetical protein AMS68_001589 [Peltaster fructicola]